MTARLGGVGRQLRRPPDGGSTPPSTGDGYHRCAYCGRRSRGWTCSTCRDLPALDPTTDEGLRRLMR